MRAARQPVAPQDFRHRLESARAARSPEERLRNDPLWFPRRRRAAGASRQDVESVALLSAMLAFGRAALFMKTIARVLDGCPPPYPAGFRRHAQDFAWPGYRFCRGDDLKRFVHAIADVSARHGGLQEAFRPGWTSSGSVWNGLAALRTALLDAASDRRRPPSPGLRYLLPDPLSGSCAKRWMLFLRWMARPDDGIDLGLWSVPPPAMLIVPLDRHVGRFARRFGWTCRAADDRRAAEEVTAALRRLDPADPARFDFALSHLGIDGDCGHGRDPAACRACALSADCGAARTPRPPGRPDPLCFRRRSRVR